MSRNAVRALAAFAFVAAAVVLGSAGGDAALAVPDRWGVPAFTALVPSLAAIGFFPGWFLVARVPGLGTGTRMALAVFVSLLLAAALGSLTLAMDVALAWPARALALLTIVGAVTALRAAARPDGPAAARARVAEVGRSGGGRFARGLVAVVFVVLVAALYAANPELRSRGDGWFHAAAASHVAQVGVPPDDPWYAGLPFRYAWAMHVAIDVLVAGAPAGTTPLGALAGWSVLAAIGLAASVVAAGTRWARAAGDMERAPWAGAWALALAAFAVHPLGFLVWVAESSIGHVRGWGEFVRPLGEGAGATLEALGSHLPHASLAFFPDKFLIPTSFGLAYATAVTALDALFLATWPLPLRAAVAGVAVLAALVFHPLAGAALVTALLVAAAVDAARGRPAPAAAAAGACAGALALAAPYLVVVMSGRAASAGPWLAFAPDMLIAIAITGCAILALAALELRRAGGPFGSGRARVGLAAAVWLLAAVTVGLVQRNETKFVSLGLLALAIPAGARAARRPVPAAVALAVGLPSVVFAIIGFANDRGQQGLGARVPSPQLAEGYAWVARHTGARDAFLEPQTADARDPVRDLLVQGPRALVWGGDSYAMNWGHPQADLARRRRASTELANGRLSEASVNWLAARIASPGRAVYAVERAGRGGDAPRALAKPGRWTRVYAGPAFALDRLEAPPVAASGAGEADSNAGTR